jgi:PhzF family phenazine biosynthesis protein
MIRAFTTIPELTIDQNVPQLAEQVRVIHAFADTRYNGNPAGVLFISDNLDPKKMAGLALYMNLPIIVTLESEGSATYHIRWFTQNSELALCGHGTMAASYVLFNELEDSTDRLCFRTDHHGELTSKLQDGSITMELPILESTGADAVTDLAVKKLLKVPVEEVLRANDDLIAVLKNEQDVVSFQPDYAAIVLMDCRGLILTARTKAGGPLAPFDIVSRFFAPKIGINEDHVCVSAHCKLQPYWSQRLGLDRSIRAFQASENGGILLLDGDNSAVTITGSARTAIRTTQTSYLKRPIKLPNLEVVDCGVRAVMAELCNSGIKDKEKKFSMAYFEIGPGGFSEPHEHDVSEIWCITSGKAMVISDGITQIIEAGGFVHLKPQSSHQLRNIGSQKIRAVSVWWNPKDIDVDA